MQSISSAASNASTDYSGSSSDCEVEQVIVKKKSAKLAAIFMGKKEVVIDDPLSALTYFYNLVERSCERRPRCDSPEESIPDELHARGVEEQGG